MKRIAAILALALMMTMVFVPSAFADNELLTAPVLTTAVPDMTADTAPMLTTAVPDMLGTAAAPSMGTVEIEKISPSDGEKGKNPSNLAVKLTFSEEVSDVANDEINASKIKITSVTEEGTTTEHAFTVVHSDKYPTELWLVLKADLVADTEYTISVQPGIVANSGNTTYESLNTTFRTRNAKTDNYISIAMMIAMVVAMVFATKSITKKNADEEAALGGTIRKNTMNPYKLAKEKNISLDEAKAIIAKENEKYEKEKAKLEAERAKLLAQREKEMAELEAKVLAEIELERRKSVFQVKGPRSIKAAGYRVPRAVADRRKAKEEAAKQAAKDALKNKKKK